MHSYLWLSCESPENLSWEIFIFYWNSYTVHEMPCYIIKHKITFKISNYFFYYKVSLYAIHLNKFLFILLNKKKMKPTTGGYI